MLSRAKAFVKKNDNLLMCIVLSLFGLGPCLFGVLLFKASEIPAEGGLIVEKYFFIFLGVVFFIGGIGMVTFAISDYKRLQKRKKN
jgi:cell division protein FtsW (lipid II flippase)